MAMVAAMSAGTAMTLASCSEAGSLKTSISTDNDRYVVTEGKIVKQYLKVGKFISVRIEGSPTVKFVQGNKHEVIVQGTKEYVDKIKTVVEGNKLVVGLKSNISFNIFKNRSDRKNLVIYVTSPDLVGVELAGSGDFICKGPIDTDRLDIQVNGSGDVDFEGNVICDDLMVELNGSGDVDFKNVDAITSSLKLIGSGDIKVGLDKCRDVESSIAGSGDVTLKGNITGRLDKSKAGSGDYNIELSK